MVGEMYRSVVMSLVFLLAALVVTDAACPKVTLMSNFQKTKYMGTWYTVQSQDSIFQSIKTCLKSDYTLVGDTVVVTTEGKNNGGRPAKDISRMTKTSNPAKMITDFIPGFSPPYEVLYTDYDSYACVHSCVGMLFYDADFVFIFSRKRKLSQTKIDHCRSLFAAYDKVKLGTLKNTPQENCN